MNMKVEKLLKKNANIVIVLDITSLLFGRLKPDIHAGRQIEWTPSKIPTFVNARFN